MADGQQQLLLGLQHVPHVIGHMVDVPGQVTEVVAAIAADPVVQVPLSDPRGTGLDPLDRPDQPAYREVAADQHQDRNQPDRRLGQIGPWVLAHPGRGHDDAVVVLDQFDECVSPVVAEAHQLQVSGPGLEVALAPLVETEEADGNGAEGDAVGLGEGRVGAPVHARADDPDVNRHALGNRPGALDAGWRTDIAEHVVGVQRDMGADDLPQVVLVEYQLVDEATRHGIDDRGQDEYPQQSGRQRTGDLPEHQPLASVPMNA